MQRVDEADALQSVRCPECLSEIRRVRASFICTECDLSYPEFKGKPVLIKQDNPLFQTGDYGSIESGPVRVVAGRSSPLGLIKKWAPSMSKNIAHPRALHRFAESLEGDRPSILVVGGGQQAKELQATLESYSGKLTFCDIDKTAVVDVFCDAHCLPFATGSFDGVITTAVLEHVLYPDACAAEMVRVLRIGGAVYSELPFLQAVHEGAYDYTRFTMSGHRRLFEDFEETGAGTVGGPGTALVWSLVGFARSFFKSPRYSTLAALAARYLFGWLRHFDSALDRNPRSLDFASCTYFIGRKAGKKTTAEQIVERYGDSSFKHT